VPRSVTASIISIESEAQTARIDNIIDVKKKQNGSQDGALWDSMSDSSFRGVAVIENYILCAV